MKPCPHCRDLITAIGQIAGLKKVADELKVVLVATILDAHPPPAHTRRRKRLADVVKLLPRNDPPVAS
jgi:hypothetical protein